MHSNLPSQMSEAKSHFNGSVQVSLRRPKPHACLLVNTFSHVDTAAN
jgi:hypothetical protein